MNRGHLIRLAALIVLVALALSLAGCNQAPAKQELEADFAVHFIDVGQGDAMILLCGGQAMLVDAGTEKSAQKLADYIKSLGVSKLDYVVATHPHADHIGGMEAVLSSFEVGVFLMPDAIHKTAVFERMLDAVAENGCEAEYVHDGMEFSLGGASVRVLSPLEGETHDNLNNYSAVLAVAFEGFKTLLTGDAETGIEDRLVEAQIGGFDLLKCGHHGSKTSSSEAFINMVNPVYAVICCGAGNEYGHPNGEVLSRLAGASVLRTDLNGTIIVAVSGGEINVRTEKDFRP